MWNIFRKNQHNIPTPTPHFEKGSEEVSAWGTKRVRSRDVCMGDLLCLLSKKNTKIKYGFEYPISNVDLSSAAN